MKRRRANREPITIDFLHSRSVEEARGEHICFAWQGARTGRGYGQIRTMGKTKRVHRVAWELANGPIPEGMSVCHRCDNPPCWNPAHLFLSDTRGNAADMMRKGRGKWGSVRGSQNPASKLDALAIPGMRVLIGSGLTLKFIGSLFGVGRKTVADIRDGRTWKHV